MMAEGGREGGRELERGGSVRWACRQDQKIKEQQQQNGQDGGGGGVYYIRNSKFVSGIEEPSPHLSALLLFFFSCSPFEPSRTELQSHRGLERWTYGHFSRFVSGWIDRGGPFIGA